MVKKGTDRGACWRVAFCALIVAGIAPLPASACQGGEWVACEHASVQHYISRFTQPSWRSWLHGVWERLSFYSDHIQAALDRHELPQELRLLPVVESAYLAKAVSHRGAVGLWQITRVGASGYPLLIGEPIDERRDFWKATEVALRTLAANHSRFGDWLLAIAAYNAGPTGVQRAIDRAGTSDFWKLRNSGALPQQTGEFVPQVLAAVHIFAHPLRYGLPPIKPVVWARVGTGGRADLRKLARLTGMDLALLSLANAELSTPFTPSDSRAPVAVISSEDRRAGDMLGYWLKVPYEHAETVRAALEERNQLFEFVEHRVSSGETFWDMAILYGSSVKLIADENPDLHPRRLWLGQTVIIPLLANSALPALPPKRSAWIQQSGSGTVHVVASGDSLWEIAQKHETTVELLAQSNGLSPDQLIKPGEVLMVPSGSVRLSSSS